MPSTTPPPKKKKTQRPDPEFTRHPSLPTFHLCILRHHQPILKYSNIPVKETRTILANILKHSMTDPQMQHRLLKWCDVITRQHYFTSNQDIVIQHDGLAMGDPSSGIIAEIFLQHTEHWEKAGQTQYPRCTDPHNNHRLIPLPCSEWHSDSVIMRHGDSSVVTVSVVIRDLARDALKDIGTSHGSNTPLQVPISR